MSPNSAEYMLLDRCSTVTADSAVGAGSIPTPVFPPSHTSIPGTVNSQQVSPSSATSASLGFSSSVVGGLGVQNEQSSRKSVVSPHCAATAAGPMNASPNSTHCSNNYVDSPPLRMKQQSSVGQSYPTHAETSFVTPPSSSSPAKGAKRKSFEALAMKSANQQIVTYSPVSSEHRRRFSKVKDA